MGHTEKRIAGAALLGLLALGTGGVGPLAFLGGAPAAAGGAAGAGTAAAGGAAASPTLGTALHGLAAAGAKGAAGALGAGGAAALMAPDQQMTTYGQPVQQQQPDVLNWLSMINKNGGMM